MKIGAISQVCALCKLARFRHTQFYRKFVTLPESEIPEGLTVFNLAPDSIGVRRKLRTTNMVEFQNKELKKRTRCIKLFPNKESLLRIATALLIELDETWLGESKRYI